MLLGKARLIGDHRGSTVAAARRDAKTEEPRWSPTTGATPRSTSGSASRATRPSIGITQYAADQLGDIVFVELPTSGATLEQFATFGVVESVKAVSDLFAPVAGEVVEVNDGLADKPELVNSDPYGDGWMIRVRARRPGPGRRPARRRPPTSSSTAEG